MEIVYKTDITPTPEQIIELYNNAGLPRPTNDPERIKKMFDNSNLIVVPGMKTNWQAYAAPLQTGFGAVTWPTWQ